MPIGVLILIGVSFLIFFGVAQRVLDRLHLTDKAAIIFIVAIIAGSYIDIPILRSPAVTLNVGGGILPIALAIYVLRHAGTTKEWVRALIAVGITGIAIYFTANYLFYNAGHTNRDLVDPQYVFALIGGIVAYITGRSRRAAFVAGVLGIFLYNLITFFVILYRGIPSTLSIGGGGFFDTMIIAGIIAVAIAEIIGETRERLGGGPVDGENRPHGLRNAEYASYLGENAEERRKKFQVKKGGKKDD